MPRRKSGFTPKAHYQKHRDTISSERKQRYLEDPEYREKVRSRSAEEARKKKENSLSKKVGKGVYEINGVIFYSGSYIAQQCGITPQLLNYYHMKGVIPYPREVIVTTYRKYTSEYALAIIQILQDSSNYTTTERKFITENALNNLINILGETKLKELSHYEP